MVGLMWPAHEGDFRALELFMRGTEINRWELSSGKSGK
jgi:hypothetical protein